MTDDPDTNPTNGGTDDWSGDTLTDPGVAAAVSRAMSRQRPGVSIQQGLLGLLLAGGGGAATIGAVDWFGLQGMREDISALEAKVEGNDEQIQASIAREHGARQMQIAMAEDLDKLASNMMAVCVKTGAVCR